MFDIHLKIKAPKFLLAFPPMQFTKDEMIRPDGTLALPYLDATLTRAGFQSRILDMSIGTPEDDLQDTFYNQVPINPKFVRVGMSPERILEEVQDVDVIGLTSIFTQQTARCFEISNLIKMHFPEKLVVGGGVNARSLKEHFFNNGFDVIFTSEGEFPLVDFARWLESGRPALHEIPGITFRQDGKIITTPANQLVNELDDLPLPAWEKLPYERYWEISRLWGGKEGLVEHDGPVRYAAIFTSRGCPFTCSYCHISKEKGSEAGDIGNLRLHSIDRVDQEFEKLKSMNVNYIYINDDSFLAKKNRVRVILENLKKYNFRLADVNGINIVHFFKRHKGNMVVDEEMLESLYYAGFRKISLPFESGTQRVIDKYASGKWRIDNCNTLDLVKKMNQIGIVADGNFMIGYPDETPEELTNTYLMARNQMDAGMVGCQFFIAQPFPGTALFDQTIANGQLSPDWHWDEMGWSKGSVFNNMKIDKDTLKFSWSLVWKLLNRSNRVKEFSEQLAQGKS